MPNNHGYVSLLILWWLDWFSAAGIHILQKTRNHVHMYSHRKCWNFSNRFLTWILVQFSKKNISGRSIYKGSSHHRFRHSVWDRWPSSMTHICVISPQQGLCTYLSSQLHIMSGWIVSRLHWKPRVAIMPDSSKPLPESILIFHWWYSLALVRNFTASAHAIILNNGFENYSC